LNILEFQILKNVRTLIDANILFLLCSIEWILLGKNKLIFFQSDISVVTNKMTIILSKYIMLNSSYNS